MLHVDPLPLFLPDVVIRLPVAIVLIDISWLMSESLPPRKTQGKSFILSLVAVLALSLFRLWSVFADETVQQAAPICFSRCQHYK